MTRWLVRFSPQVKPTCRLVCFAHAGGGPSIFSQWPQLVAPTIEVCGAELPGHGANRDPALRDVREIVGPLCDALGQLGDAPVALFGHSMGALLAYEVAHEIERRGAKVAWLFPSAYPAPHLPSTAARTSELGSSEFLAEVSRYYSTKDAGEAAFLEELEPVLRADFELCERYTHGAARPLDTPISIFCGISDHTVAKSEIDAWSVLTSRAFRRREMPGDHMCYRESPTRMLRVIDKELASVERAR
jgi:medium-chain acyl-[acyl-carrier-protein] hydrolase